MNMLHPADHDRLSTYMNKAFDRAKNFIGYPIAQDFDYAQLADKGGLQKAWNVFGEQLDGLLEEMNEELVA